MTDSERLIRVISESGMTAKDFAAKVEVGQGTISNIASGRNNPSLDVMQRVLQNFPNVRPEWLIMGIEPMYRDGAVVSGSTSTTVEPDLFSGNTAESDHVESAANGDMVETSSEATTASSSNSTTPIVVEKIVERVTTKTIQKIVIFYTDGTYEER